MNYIPNCMDVVSEESGGRWQVVDKTRDRIRRKVKWENLVSIFVNNLLEVAIVDQLRLAFTFVGRVYDAFILASGKQGRGVCFSFVRFGGMETALKAVNMMNGRTFAGRQLEVNMAILDWSQKDKGPRVLVKDRVRSVEQCSKTKVKVSPEERKNVERGDYTSNESVAVGGDRRCEDTQTSRARSSARAPGRSDDVENHYKSFSSQSKMQDLEKQKHLTEIQTRIKADNSKFHPLEQVD